MAVISTVITAVPKMILFSTVGGPVGDDLAPQGVVNFSQNFTSTGVTDPDVEELTVNMNLPINYFYRLIDFSLTLYAETSTVALAWRSEMLVEVQSAARSTTYLNLLDTNTINYKNAAGNAVRWAIPSDQWETATALMDGRLRAGVDPQIIIRGYEGGGATLAAASFNLQVNYLQYTIEQAANFPVWTKWGTTP